MIQKLAEPSFLYHFISLSHCCAGSLAIANTSFFSFFLAILLEIFLLAWDHRPVSSPKFSIALALRQTASHLTLKYFCKARSSWSIQWLQGDSPVIIIIIMSPLCLTACMKWLCWCAVFAFCQTQYCALQLQSSALWPNISPHRSLVDFSDATLQI